MTNLTQAKRQFFVEKAKGEGNFRRKNTIISSPFRHIFTFYLKQRIRNARYRNKGILNQSVHVNIGGNNADLL